MKTTKTVFPLLLAIALAGCVSPGGSSRHFTYVDPQPDGYYTGGHPDFAKRFNPDPQGRKFCVAYLRICLKDIEGLTGGTAIKADAEKAMDVFYGSYMGFREQAKDSHRGQYYKTSKEMFDTGQASVKSNFAYEKSKIELYVAAAHLVAVGGWNANGGVLGEPVPSEFAKHWEDMAFLNAELATRYPNLFTSDESGFPLDLTMIGLYKKDNPVERTRFEAWCVGLPEHANIGWENVFKPSEVFLDPYEAVAAALFKLTDEQFEGLEPANPKDHDWLEENAHEDAI